MAKYIEIKDKPMSPQAFALKMRRITSKRAYESEFVDCAYTHAEGDKLLCKMLKELGYGQGVELFEAMEKWYE